MPISAAPPAGPPGHYRQLRRARAIAAFAVALCGIVPAPAGASSRDVEIDLRNSMYLFGVPSGSLGPFDSEKFDVTSSGAMDELLLHVVSTNRIDPSGGAHGEFLRLEDDYRLGASTVRLAAGVGGGVLGQRCVTLGFAQAVSRSRRIALSAAVDLTSLSPDHYQRVVGVGPEVALGRVSIFARYYHATTTNQPPAPSSASVLASAPISRQLGLSLAANFGGELNADRTSGFLPTSSGRFGTDLSVGVATGLGKGVGMLAAYEAADYRGPPRGGLSRIQHIVTFGISIQPLRG